VANFTAPGGDLTLSAFLKAATQEPWSQVKRLIERGKVFVDEKCETDVARRLAAGQRIEIRGNAPRPRDPLREGVLVFDDPHVVVIDKPSGVSSVPYEDRERGTAMDLIRATWKRLGKPSSSVGLHVVHRIDKSTSGLLMFAKSKRAELALAAQLRAHTCERTYVCVAHGTVEAARIESYLVTDRGDGLRGSTRRVNQGKRAVTHVAIRQHLRGATLCEVRLETGKTHQIRIHLAEAGHPLLGEAVYMRDYENAGGRLLPATRLMLHAQTLGFAHPATGEAVRLSADIPDDFARIVAGLT
jgi:23S rRNA pseudouridine1911/1915/1917 synthase